MFWIGIGNVRSLPTSLIISGNDWDAAKSWITLSNTKGGGHSSLGLDKTLLFICLYSFINLLHEIMDLIRHVLLELCPEGFSLSFSATSTPTVELLSLIVWGRGLQRCKSGYNSFLFIISSCNEFMVSVNLESRKARVEYLNCGLSEAIIDKFSVVVSSEFLG